MVSDTIELHVEDWIKQGIQEGKYYLQGGVVREATGKREIVYWLKAGDTSVSKKVQSLGGNQLGSLGNAISIFGFGLMQVNFLVVYKKLSRIEKKIDELSHQLFRVEEILREIQRRQMISALARGITGCQLAHEATRMNDQSASKHQMVIAKAALFEADIFFTEELKKIDPLRNEFWLLFELIFEIRLSCVRSCVFLNDLAIAREKLEELQEAVDTFALKCLRRDTFTAELFESKCDRVNLVLSTRELLEHYISEVDAIDETKAVVPYRTFAERSKNG